MPIWAAWALAAAIATGVSYAVARALRIRLSHLELVLAITVPLAVLAPWLGPTILAPVEELHDSGQLLIAQHATRDPGPMAVLGDVTHQLLPWELAVRQALSAGRLPEWDDRFGLGTCLACNPQARVFDPIAWVGRATVGLPDHLEITVLVAWILAICGGTVAAGCLGIRSPARVFVGLAWGLSGATTAWALFPNGAAAVWLPWLLAAFVRLGRSRRGHGRGVAVAGGVLGCALLAGNPQVLLWATPAFVVVAVALSRSGERRSVTWRLALAVLAGGLLAAPQLLPFAAITPASTRAVEKSGAVASEGWFDRGGLGFARMALDSWAAGRPYGVSFDGPTNWPEALSVHSGPLAGLALLALLGLRGYRRRVIGTLAILAVVGFTVGSGFRPVLTVLESLPGGGIPSHTRALPLLPLALALLQGLAIDRLRNRSWLPRALGVLLVGALVVHTSGFDRAGLAVVVLLPWCLRTAGARASGPHPRLLDWRLIGVLAIALSLGATARSVLPSGAPHFFFPANDATALIADELASPGGPWRVAGESYEAYPSLLAVHGFEEARPHDPLASARVVRLFGAAFGMRPSATAWYAPLEHPEHPIGDVLGIRVWVSNHAQPPRSHHQRLDEPWSLGLHALWRNPRALPRAFVPSKVETVETTQIEAWLSELADPRVVAVEGAAPCRAPTGSATARVHAPGSMSLELSGTPCLVVVSVPWTRGWSAIDPSGERLTIRPADLALLAIEPAAAIGPAGAATITLRYRAPGLRLGLVLAAVTAVGLGLGACAVERPRARAKAADATPS